jgi:hypothetical protein
VEILENEIILHMRHRKKIMVRYEQIIWMEINNKNKSNNIGDFDCYLRLGIGLENTHPISLPISIKIGEAYFLRLGKILAIKYPDEYKIKKEKKCF